MAQVLAIPEPARFGRSYVTVWGLAELGKSLVAGTFGALLPIFYQDYLGLQARWIAIASVIYAVWNAINDPLFGYITDNTRSKRGRRIPYLRFTAPFLGLTFILVWLAPRGAGQIALFWWMLGGDAAVRHVLHHHRPRLLGAAARGDRARTASGTGSRCPPRCWGWSARCSVSSSRISSGRKPAPPRRVLPPAAGIDGGRRDRLRGAAPALRVHA